LLFLDLVAILAQKNRSPNYLLVVADLMEKIIDNVSKTAGHKPDVRFDKCAHACVCMCARLHIYIYTDVYGYTSANSEITETAHLPFNSFSFCVFLVAMDTIMSMFQQL